MRNIFTGLILLFAMTANAQELNKKIEDPTRHKQVLINKCSREGITTFAEFKESYDPNYAAYKPDSAVVPSLEKAFKGHKVTIVLGTWCGDSKLQVPHFLKIMDAMKVKAEDITIIAVDGVKKAEAGLIDNLKITNVPTFIFNDEKGTEIGRITESPRETLEKDILVLLSAKPATNTKPDQKF